MMQQDQAQFLLRMQACFNIFKPSKEQKMLYFVDALKALKKFSISLND